MANLADLSRQFSQISVDGQDVNILLMGETGVGKSTFINAFANYMEYDKFHVAEKSPVRCLIPSSFTVIDENMHEKTVQIGRDKNENEEVGESATQGARSYVFPLSKSGKRIRLIDTPGVGDTRGLNQDSINFENILTYISNMDYLHAICFLLKPNNSRITVYFEYCIKQLLSRLEKSASQNIIFLFTNSRSSFYRPGDTAPALKKILEQIRSKPPHVDIKFEKGNVFCLDNEAFRFMVSYKEGIRFTENDKESFSRSWQQSVGECWRMIEFITGSGNSTNKLTPHKVRDTLSVNNARRIVIQLSRPLADIADLINDNINLMQRHNDTLTKENVSIEDLKKRLYVPVVNLRHKELKQPTTICTNASCCEIYMVADKKKYHYKQRCHDPCYLQNVPAEMIGSPELLHCYAILPTKKCRECSCDFSVHMHVYYLSETYEDKITDTGIQSQITDRETAVKETRKLIRNIESRKNEFDRERQVIVRSMAKFAHFLQHNAIAPYNDTYKAYIEYLIDRENSYANDADNQLITHYCDMLKRYDEEKQILDDALRMNAGGATSTVTSSDIFQAVESLFMLKHTGKKIKELHDNQTNSRKAEVEDNTEYVLDAVEPRSSLNPSIKGVGKKTRGKKSNKNQNTTTDDDEISQNVKERFQDMFEQFPEMEEFFAQKHRQKCDEDSSGKQQKNYKNQNQQGAYKKGQQNNAGQQNRGNAQKQNRGRGQNHNQGRGGKYNNNTHQNFNHPNQVTGAYNHELPNQKPYSQGLHIQNQRYNPNQGQQEPHQNQGPYNQRQNYHNQNFNPHNQNPGNYNQAPGYHNQGPGPYNQGPRPYNQGPGPYNQGPGPYNQGPGPYNQGPGLYNQGPRPYNQGPGSHNQGPPCVYNPTPGPYNQFNQAPGPYNLSQQPFNNQEPPPPYSNSQIPQDKASDYNRASQGPYGANLYNAPRDDSGDWQEPRSDKERITDKNKYDRPSGPYSPNDDDKDSDQQFSHINKYLEDCEMAQDEAQEEDDVDFQDFMIRHGCDVNEGGAGGVYEKNSRGGARGRGRGGNRGRGRGGRTRRSKSRNGFDDGESDSGHSYSSRGTNRSNHDGYRRAETFEIVRLGDGERNRNEERANKKGVMDFFKTLF